MRRRTALRLLTVAGASLALQGHSPYRQWAAFRGSRVLVLASATDPAAVLGATAIAAVLATHLPQSRAQMTRARDTRDAMSLLASHQLEVALLAADDARAATEGRTDVGAPVPLLALAAFGGHLLVVSDHLPAEQATAILRTLAERGDADGVRPTRPDAGSTVPLHPAAQEFWRSRAAVPALR